MHQGIFRKTALLLVLIVAMGFLLTSPTFVLGDTVFYTDGSSQEGVVILENDDEVWLEIDTGKTKAVVKVPRKSVLKIVKGTTTAQRNLALYNSKLEKMNQNSARDWFLLGSWCENFPTLTHKARICYRKSVELDPEYSPSHIRLGNVRYDGVWMDYDTMMRSKGYIKFRGSWMTVEAKMQIIIKEQELAIIREQLRLKNSEKARLDAQRRLLEARKAPARERVVTRERIVYQTPAYSYSPLWYGIPYYHTPRYYHRRIIYPIYQRYPYRIHHFHNHCSSGVGVSYTKRTSHSSFSIGFIFR